MSSYGTPPGNVDLMHIPRSPSLRFAPRTSAILAVALLAAACGSGSGGARGGDAKDASAGAGGASAAGGASSAGGRAVGSSGGAQGAGGTPPAPVALQKVQPNPIISRGRPVTASGGDAGILVDGTYKNAPWATPLPAWAAIDLGAGPSRILVHWSNAVNRGFDPDDGQTTSVPSAYVIEVSADGSSWTEAARVTGNQMSDRAHSVDFEGMSRVRLTVTAIDGPETQTWLDEIEVYDISNGAKDTWFFMGDSITAGSFDRTHQPSFAENVRSKYPAHFPDMIDGGVGGVKAEFGAAHIDEWLAAFPDHHHWVLGYGANDGGTPLDEYEASMQSIIDKVRAAGRVPLIPRISYAIGGDRVPLYNEKVDELTRRNGLTPGPDLYQWFLDHPEQLSDGLHPTVEGARAINRLWAEAVESAYTE
jgi:lysophospholipase L1-like esterase